MERIRPILRTEDDPKSADMVRFVCISDTHSHNKMQLPPGDVLLHAGDFTSNGCPKQVRSFNRFLASSSFAHKVVIAGNHDLTFDTLHFADFQGNFSLKENVDPVATKGILTEGVYLEDSGVEVCGYKVWGSPWTPKYFNWAFGLPRGEEIRAKWDLIPPDTDILVTHTPPNQLLDMCADGTTPAAETSWTVCRC